MSDAGPSVLRAEDPLPPFKGTRHAARTPGNSSTATIMAIVISKEKSMNLLIFCRTSVLAAFAMALCLWVPDPGKGFGPGATTPTLRPDSSTNRAGEFGTRQRRRGSGTFFRQRRLFRERMRMPRAPDRFVEPGNPETWIEPPPTRVSRRVEKRPLVKLAKPRVPYLAELAMDMEQSLITLVRRDPVKAVRVYAQALKDAKRVKDPKREWTACANLGHVYYLTGRFVQAAACYSRAAAISKRQSDPVGEGIALRNLGATLTASGEYRRAEEQSLAALEKFKLTARAKDAQMSLNNLGVLARNRSRYRDAEDYFGQASDITADPSEVRARVLRNVGNFRKLWGEYERAVHTYTTYGKVAAALGNQSEAAEALLDVASVQERQGLYTEALEKARQAVRIQSTAKIDTDWSKKLMGDLLLEMGRPAEADHYVKEAGYDSSIGLLNLAKSQPHQAKKHYLRLLDAATKEQNLDEMFTAHTGLGKAYEATQEYARAERHYEKAVGITEEIRASLLLCERKNFFSEKISGFARSEPAKGLARVALKRNNPVAAIYAGEVTKARRFADNLSQRTEGRHFDVPAELLEKEAELTNTLASLKTALNAVPRALDTQRYQEMVKEIKRENSKRKAFARTLCEKCPEYCSVKYPQPVRMRDSRINDAEYVLVFDVLGDAVGITLLHGKRVVRSHLTPWQTRELERQVQRLRKPFEQVRLTRFSPELAHTLYEKLLADALKSVPQGSSITIIPDGPLALVPFEALVAGGKPVWKQGSQGDYPAGLTYVADLYSIAYYQSLTAMTLVRTLRTRNEDAKRMLVMADPVFQTSDERVQSAALQVTQPRERPDEPRAQQALDEGRLAGFTLRRLPESEKLGESLKGLLGTNCQLYTGLKCTKHAFLNKFSEKSDPYIGVVFGTHGFAANDLPGIMEPVLALTMVPRGTDGFLTMSEVSGLKMDVDIAALTACKTGLGMRLAGEGVLSMGRAFQAAGARSVIMSLWSVAERPSILLMEEFFKELSQGSDKLAAWTGARAHIRKEGFEHPFFWASFILVGEVH